jgi:hypothetical protein
MTINDIGLLLIKSINNNSSENKTTFLKTTKVYKDKNEEDYNKNLEDISYYISKYENKRNEYRNLYDEYLSKRFNLYMKWKKSKNVLDLDNLIKLNRPHYEEVPDIYTKKRPKINLRHHYQ